jgi:hypothetical protein
MDMPRLNIDELLEKNPHLDKEAVKRRQQEIAERGSAKQPTKQWPISPYGRQKRGDVGWGSDGVRSHYTPRRISK